MLKKPAERLSFLSSAGVWSPPLLGASGQYQWDMEATKQNKLAFMATRKMEWGTSLGALKDCLGKEEDLGPRESISILTRSRVSARVAHFLPQELSALEVTCKTTLGFHTELRYCPPRSVRPLRPQSRPAPMTTGKPQEAVSKGWGEAERKALSSAAKHGLEPLFSWVLWPKS